MPKDHWKGKQFSEEHRAKLAAVKRGRPLTKAHKRAISQGMRRHFESTAPGLGNPGAEQLDLTLTPSPSPTNERIDSG